MTSPPDHARRRGVLDIKTHREKAQAIAPASSNTQVGVPSGWFMVKEVRRGG